MNILFYKFQILLLNYYNNLLLINTYNNNYFSASIICEKINEYVNTNSDDDFTRQLKNYVSFSLMQYHKTFENEFDADEYINLMNQLKKGLNQMCQEIHILFFVIDFSKNKKPPLL